MEAGKYLNEERYQKTKRKLSVIAFVVLLLALLGGGSLIAIGVTKQKEVNEKYSEKSKEEVQEKLEVEKQNLTNAKTALEAKIKPVEDEIKRLKRVPFAGMDEAYYERQDKIEELEKNIAADKTIIEMIDDALDESFDHCGLTELKNNKNTAKYCSFKNQLNEFTEFNKKFASSDSTPFYMIGAFVIIVGSMIAFVIFMTAKGRERAAFGAQQILPIAQEGMEAMVPTVGKVAKEMIPVVKESMEELTPAMKDAAKEITKGIKEGMKDEKE